MLNLSENKIYEKINTEKYSVFSKVVKDDWDKRFRRLLLYVLFVVLLFMFLPWTQNVSSNGYLTTLFPDQRPQTVHSMIGGMLQKWYVKEGDFVNKGDTLVYISEVKSDYFDPELIARTSEQVDFKESSIQSYGAKIKALENQKKAFKSIRDLKLEQYKNKVKQCVVKVKSDSVDFISLKAQLTIAEKQFKRTEDLHKKGLKSLKEVEIANVKLQEVFSKTIAQENYLYISRNELLNSRIEISSLQNEYIEKVSKIESDQSSVLSDQQEAGSNKSKMMNQLSNYKIRQGYYFITAPNTGYVTKLVRSGIGEIIKEGEELLTVMPEKYDLAVEFYVEPMNYPLLNKGEHVRLQFDGWPAIVFGGWPDASFGTFGGTILAIDNFSSSNGLYRVIAVPDKKTRKWPKGLRVGGGVKTFTMLKNVPVWYEIWRNLNGFPAEFYAGKSVDGKNKKKK